MVTKVLVMILDSRLYPAKWKEHPSKENSAISTHYLKKNIPTLKAQFASSSLFMNKRLISTLRHSACTLLFGLVGEKLTADYFLKKLFRSCLFCLK